MGSNVGIKNFQIWNLELKLEYLLLLHVSSFFKNYVTNIYVTYRNE